MSVASCFLSLHCFSSWKCRKYQAWWGTVLIYHTWESGVVVHSFNLPHLGVRLASLWECEASQRYTVKPCLQNKNSRTQDFRIVLYGRGSPHYQ